jgi:hypothetical protein
MFNSLNEKFQTKSFAAQYNDTGNRLDFVETITFMGGRLSYLTILRSNNSHNCGKYEQQFVKFCYDFNIKVCDIVKLFT